MAYLPRRHITVKPFSLTVAAPVARAKATTISGPGSPFPAFPDHKTLTTTRRHSPLTTRLEQKAHGCFSVGTLVLHATSPSSSR